MEPRLSTPPLVLVLGLAVGCTLEVAPPAARQGDPLATADTTLVLAELRAYYRDMSARDWEAYREHFWPRGTITTVWAAPGEDDASVQVSTIDEFVARAPEGPGSRSIFEETMLSSRITTAGDLAQAWVRYHARFGDPGDVMEWDGTDVFTLLRHDGRWRIVSLVFASNEDPS